MRTVESQIELTLDPSSEIPRKAAVVSVSSCNTAPEPRPSWREMVKYWTGLDRAIGFFVLARLWAACAGVVSVLMTAHFLTPIEQGYYYTFYSLVALQVVFELGFGFVVLQFVAHERARLSFDENGKIAGEAASHSRLASLLKLILRWYTAAATVLIVVLLPAGSHFFHVHQRAGSAASWGVPWSLLVIAAACNVFCWPLVAFVEGCGYVPDVAQMYLGQAVLGSLLSWTAMVTRHGLYAPALVILAQVALQVYLLTRRRFRRILINLLRRPPDVHKLDWYREVWPFQWKMAVSWCSSYIINQMMTAILFSTQGPRAAGRMGMSLSIATQLGTIGLSWMSTKASPFGNMIARGEITELNRVFFRTLWQSTTLVTTAAIGVFGCLLFVDRRFPSLAIRVLSPWAFGLLLVTMVMNHILSCEALYMRAHKREPLIIQAAVVAVLLGTTTVILGHTFGANAVTVGYFAFAGLVSLTWGTYIFRSKRKQWYGSATSRIPQPA